MRGMAETDEGFKKLMLDLFNWERYSTLQKVAVLFIASCILSWFSSLWTLALILVLSFGAGYKLSEQALHHEKASLIAEQVLDKLESVYLQIRDYFFKVKTAFHQVSSGQQGLASCREEDNSLVKEITLAKETDQLQSSSLTSINLPNNVGQELNSIQLLILRDFIRSWYADYSYDPQFLKDTKLLLQQTFINLVSRVAQQDPNVSLTQVIKLFMVHVASFQKARNSFQSHKVHPNTKVETGSTLRRHSSIDEAFGSLTTFHCALESDQLEQEYLKGVMSLFVVCSCNNQVIKGVCARTLLVDILAQNIMLPLIEMISEPDWLMNIIVRITSYEEEATKPGNTCAHGEGTNTDCDEVRDATVVEAESTQDHEDTGVRCNHDNSGTESQGTSTTLMPVEVTIQACDNIDVSAESQDNEENSKKEAVASRDTMPSSTKIRRASLNLSSDTLDLQAFSSPDECGKPEGCTTKEKNSHRGQTDSVKNHILFRTSESDDVKDKHSSSLSSQSDEDVGKEMPRQECNADDHDLEDIEVDPQKMISFSSSPKSTSFKDLTLISATPDLDTGSEHSTQSVSKLSSLKHFLVDSLKPGSKQQQPPQVVKKPKTLSIITGLTSNLNPLSSKNSKSSSGVDKANQSTTPKLLVDGVPMSRETGSTNDLSELAAGSEKVEDWQITPALSDCDVSPATGFFSNFNSLFSFSASSSARNSNSESALDANSISPLLTPSPTTQEALASANKDLQRYARDNSWDDVVKSYILDDRRIFQDVSIPETSVNTEYRSSTQYSLYIIHYEALYFSEEGKSIIRSGSVRRRYREFTNLQSRLESQPSYKQFMKKIRGPKRWPSLPFKSIDKETVEARRLFLEKYLKDLIEIEAICNSPDIREFLAYEGDSHIAFVKKSPEINVPRIDKMLIRGVSGVVDRIRSIPNNAQEVISGLRSRETPEDRVGTKPVDQFDMDTFEIHHGFAQRMEMKSSNLLWDSCVTTMDDSGSDAEDDLFNISKVLADQKTTDKMEMVYRQEVEKILESLPSVGRNEPGLTDNSNKTADLPDDCQSDKNDIVSRDDLGLIVIDLLVQGLQGTDHWLIHDRVVQSLQAVLGKALNRYLSSSISKLVSQEELAFYLLTLRETIWPQGQLWTDKSAAATADSSSPATTTATTTTTGSKEIGCDEEFTQEEQEELKRSKAKAKACRAIGSMFPESVKLAIGKREFDDLITVFLDSLQSERLNRNLLYQILDQLLENLFPEVATFDLIHNLLFSSLSPNLTMPRLIKEAEKL